MNDPQRVENKAALSAHLPRWSGPLGINWHLSYRCNYSCQHCYSRPLDATAELSLDQLQEIALMLAKSGAAHINFAGGEPLLAENCVPLLRFIRSHTPIASSLTTNGSRVTERTAHELSRLLNSAIVSVDGPIAINNQLRQAGSYQLARRAVQRLASAGLRVSINTSINSMTSGSIRDMLEDVLSWEGVQRVNLLPTKETPAFQSTLSMTGEELRRCYGDVIDFARRNGETRISVSDVSFSALLDVSDEWLFPVKKTDCGCGDSLFTIGPNGDVLTCPFDGTVMGHALTTPSLRRLPRPDHTFCGKR